MAILSSDKLVVVKAFAPSNPLPLDAREIYESLAEAKAYAASSAVAYAGQTIKVVEGGIVSMYTLAPSTVEGENFALQLCGGGGGGVQTLDASDVAGNIAVGQVNGDKVESKNVPVVGAFVDVAVAPDTETESEKTEFTFKNAANEDQKKAIHATGVRKVEAGSVADKVKVTTADAAGTLTSTEILIGAGSVKNPTYEAETRKITLPVLQSDGTTTDVVIDLGKDMVVKSGVFNEETHEIELTLTDNSVVRIPAAALVDVYKGAATATVTVSVAENEITAVLNVSTIEGNLLKTDETGAYVVEADFVATKQLITDAEAAAKAHADAELAKEVTAREQSEAALKTEVNKYTDDKVAAEATARSTAITEAIAQEVINRDSAIATAEEEATKYTDDEIAKEVAARNTAIEEAVAAEAELREAADTAETEARTKAITDAIAQEVTDRNAAIATAKAEANKYTDDELAAAEATIATAIATAKKEATDYTDTKVAAEATARDEAIAVETAAREAAIAQEVTDRNAAIETAVAEEATARNEAIATAKKEATDYTDTKVAEEATARDEAIAAEATARNEAIAVETAAREAAIAQEVTDRNAAIETAVAEEATAREAAIAQEATARDEAISAEATARNEAIATAKAEATSYTDTQTAAALAEAKEYAQGAADAVAIQWFDFGA